MIITVYFEEHEDEYAQFRTELEDVIAGEPKDEAACTTAVLEALFGDVEE